MYLCRELMDGNAKVFPMCGCFPFRSRMHSHRSTLGYRQVRLLRDSLLGREGAILRGHEFHYSDLAPQAPAAEIETAYAVNKGIRGEKNDTPEGYHINRTLGSYIHLHFGSRPESAASFVNACRVYRQERIKHEQPIHQEEQIMLLYWRIQQDLNALGENLIFHEPCFKRCLRIWMKKNATGIALAQECQSIGN